jgi:hypothetical protein
LTSVSVQTQSVVLVDIIARDATGHGFSLPSDSGIELSTTSLEALLYGDGGIGGVGTGCGGPPGGIALAPADKSAVIVILLLRNGRSPVHPGGYIPPGLTLGIETITRADNSMGFAFPDASYIPVTCKGTGSLHTRLQKQPKPAD